MELTKEEYEDVSYIFYPNEKYKIPFTSKWEHTRENIGKHIVDDNFPVSFVNARYFELHSYLVCIGKI